MNHFVTKQTGLYQFQGVVPLQLPQQQAQNQYGMDQQQQQRYDTARLAEQRRGSHGSPTSDGE